MTCEMPCTAEKIGGLGRIEAAVVDEEKVIETIILLIVGKRGRENF